jgi:hypothetical protein
LTLRAHWTGYAVFAALLLPIAGLATYLYWKHPGSNLWQAALAALIMLGGFWAYLASLKLIIEEDRLRYEALFFLSREVAYGEIASARIYRKKPETGRTKVPVPILELELAGRGRPVRIALKPFDWDGLVSMAQILKTKIPAFEDRLFSARGGGGAGPS